MCGEEPLHGIAFPLYDAGEVGGDRVYSIVAVFVDMFMKVIRGRLWPAIYSFMSLW